MAIYLLYGVPSTFTFKLIFYSNLKIALQVFERAAIPVNISGY